MPNLVSRGRGVAAESGGTAVADIFNSIPKNIGIGCIFAAGVLSILKMSGVIVTALRQARTAALIARLAKKAVPITGG